MTFLKVEVRPSGPPAIYYFPWFQSATRADIPPVSLVWKVYVLTVLLGSSLSPAKFCNSAVGSQADKMRALVSTTVSYMDGQIMNVCLQQLWHVPNRIKREASQVDGVWHKSLTSSRDISSNLLISCRSLDTAVEWFLYRIWGANSPLLYCRMMRTTGTHKSDGEVLDKGHPAFRFRSKSRSACHAHSEGKSCRTMKYPSATLLQ